MSSVSSVQSGYSIIQQSQKMADEAADDIRNSTSSRQEFTPDRNLEFNDAENVKVKHVDGDNVEPFLKLNQASQYNRVGTNIVQREQDMIGNLLDLHI